MIYNLFSLVDIILWVALKTTIYDSHRAMALIYVAECSSAGGVLAVVD